MIEGFLFGLLFITFTIGISYIIGEYIENKDEKQNRWKK
jgi:hypothetical protein